MIEYSPPAPCEICKRAARGFQFVLQNKSKHFCSMECMEAHVMTIRKRIKLSTNEGEAVNAASQEAGAYLDGIGKTDLATLSPEEWTTFCQTLFQSACDDLARQASEKVPF